MGNTFRSVGGKKSMGKEKTSYDDLKQYISSDSELKVCAHSNTTDIKLVADILLD